MPKPHSHPAQPPLDPFCPCSAFCALCLPSASAAPESHQRTAPQRPLPRERGLPHLHCRFTHPLMLGSGMHTTGIPHPAIVPHSGKQEMEHYDRNM